MYTKASFRYVTPYLKYFGMQLREYGEIINRKSSSDNNWLKNSRCKILSPDIRGEHLNFKKDHIRFVVDGVDRYCLRINHDCTGHRGTFCPLAKNNVKATLTPVPQPHQYQIKNKNTITRNKKVQNVSTILYSRQEPAN